MPMFVVKRDGTKEIVSFDKVLKRLETLCNDDIDISIVVEEIAQKVITMIHNNINTYELDVFAAELCSSMIPIHPDYGKLASRLIISNHQKRTSPSFSETISILYNNFDEIDQKPNPLVSRELYNIVMANRDKLNSFIKYERDFYFDYFGFKTLEKSYLIKCQGKVFERPQHMLMRVALGIHGDDFKDALETYEMMSQRYFIHATPTLFNAGTECPQMSSCFLLDMQDSLDDIMKIATECALISKTAGGIGINVHKIRATSSYIRGTNGTSNGLVPMLRMFNSISRYVDQGGGKRPGSIAVYLEPWHADIFAFLDLRKNHGKEEQRARDLFYALWIPDLFMKRVAEQGKWSLMCPDKCKGLSLVYGEEFEKLYTKYEAEGKYNEQVDALTLWYKILTSQVETGTPYILYKDAVNKKTNQKNLGTIQSSNLCVSGDTMILTKEGYFPIKEKKDMEVEVWNGEEFSKTIVRQTGTNQKLLTIEFSNGMKLNCTPYHKFYIEIGARPSQYSVKKIVEAKDLEEGMRIIKYKFGDNKCNDSQIEMESPYTHGMFCAEGTYSKNPEIHKIKQCSYKKYKDTEFCKHHQNSDKEYENDKCSANVNVPQPLLYLYSEKMNLLKFIDYDKYSFSSTSNRYNIILNKKIKEKYFVPLNYSINTKLRWLEGYFDGDGCVLINNGIKNLQIVSINKEFLTKVYYLLQTLGVKSSIGVASLRRQTLMPDGKGGKQYYDCKKSYRLNVGSIYLSKLIKLGFSPKRLNIEDLKLPHHDTHQFIKIKLIQDNNLIEDTYCFNEPKRHMGIFNGILTGNCSEILEYTSKEETAICNLCSLCLPTYVREDDNGRKYYDHEFLHKNAKIVTKNLNKVIDRNFYPSEKARRSNMRHRPIGIGISGLANVFVKMRVPFDSNEAKKLNREIMETIYHGAIEASMELAKKRTDIYNHIEELNQELLNPKYDDYESSKDKLLEIKQEIERLEKHLNLNKWELEDLERDYIGCYSSFHGSPASKGILQFDMWNVVPDSGRYDWNTMKQLVKEHGLRNSLLVALMPTASTGQIMGVNECFEPFTSNLYTRVVNSGEFVLFNKDLVADLVQLGLWSEDMRKEITIAKGSIGNIESIPKDIRDLYKTAWEIKQKDILSMSADRGAYVCQTQSQNLFVAKPNAELLTKIHFYGWRQGLKTGMYYLRTRKEKDIQQFTVEPEKETQTAGNNNDAMQDDQHECLSCSA